MRSWVEDLPIDAWIPVETGDPAHYVEMWLRDSGRLVHQREDYERESPSGEDRQAESSKLVWAWSPCSSLRRARACANAMKLEGESPHPAKASSVRLHPYGFPMIS